MAATRVQSRSARATQSRQSGLPGQPTSPCQHILAFSAITGPAIIDHYRAEPGARRRSMVGFEAGVIGCSAGALTGGWFVDDLPGPRRIRESRALRT
jgi:hypothetical protein